MPEKAFSVCIKDSVFIDPACGTGGMLSVAQNKMQALNATTRVIPFGQELNPETYATCCSDMILKGNTNSRIVLGNSFNEDGFQGQTFDYMLSNPPFGVEWKKVEKFIKDEAKNKGYSFGIWWLYGWMLFIVAIIHVNLIPDKTAQHFPSNVQTYIPPNAGRSAADELKKYKELKDQGVITEEEFQAKKDELMKLL